MNKFCLIVILVFSNIWAINFTYIPDKEGRVWKREININNDSINFDKTLNDLSVYECVQQIPEWNVETPFTSADADHDGKIEIYIGDPNNGTIKVYEFDKELNYTIEILHFYGVTWATGDIDNNGLVELVIQAGDPGIYGNGYLRIYESPDPHSLPSRLKAELVFPERKVEYWAYVKDLDNDGKQDLIFSANGFGPGNLLVYEWDGGELRLKWTAPEIHYYTRAKAIADFDNNNKTEFVVIEERDDISLQYLRAYECVGNDQYELFQNIVFGWEPVDVAPPANVDGGNPELVVGTNRRIGDSRVFEWLIYKKNSGQFSLWWRTNFSSTSIAAFPQHTVEDYDLDGADEILVDDHPTVKILEFENGAMQVGWTQNLSAEYPNSFDLRNNSRSNFLIADRNGSELKIYEDYRTITGGGHIEQNTSWDTDMLVTGDVWVNTGVTLTINSNITVNFVPQRDDQHGGIDPKRCELIIEGILNSVSSQGTAIKYISNSFFPIAGDWYGIRLKALGFGNFNHCNINNAYCGIEATGTVNNGLSIYNSNILSNQVYGMKIMSAPSAIIETCNINSNLYGIYCDQVDNLSIAKDSFLYNARTGIFLGHEDNGRSATIVNNYLNGNSDIMPTLYGIYLGQCGDGVIIDTNKIVQWSQCGIDVDKESNVHMNFDTILYNKNYGIFCYNSSCPTIRWCDMERNQEGVHSEEGSYPDLGIDGDNPGNNSIDTTNYYYVANKNRDQTQSIYAIYNWWGADKPRSDKFVGNVVYKPFWPYPPDDGQQSAGIITTTPMFALYAPKPNPANREVKIAYSIPSRCKTELVIYNTSGRIITKSIEEKESGCYEYLWNSREFPNGVYIIRLKANDKLSTQKVVVSK